MDKKIASVKFCIFFSFTIRPVIQVNDFYFISNIFIITCKLYRGGLSLDRVESQT